jgi:hypothetical protein
MDRGPIHPDFPRIVWFYEFCIALSRCPTDLVWETKWPGFFKAIKIHF